MANNDIALMAHLMRRAGFGAPYEELEVRAAKGYEATVEEFLYPENQPDGIEMDLLERYFTEWQGMLAGGPNYWGWRMINSRRPLEEKDRRADRRRARDEGAGPIHVGRHDEHARAAVPRCAGRPSGLIVGGGASGARTTSATRAGL